jgi:hypothetical protein
LGLSEHAYLARLFHPISGRIASADSSHPMRSIIPTRCVQFRIRRMVSAMSKTTWVLLLLAAVCYLSAWTAIAGALALFGVVFELLMYISMFSDAKKTKGD